MFLCISRQEAAAYGNICPVCGKKLTIGVLHRVEQLADRDEDFVLSGRSLLKAWFPPGGYRGLHRKIWQLPKGIEQYESMLVAGAEFEILRNIPVEDIKKLPFCACGGGNAPSA